MNIYFRPMKSSYYRDFKGQGARAPAQCVAFWTSAALGRNQKTEFSLPIADCRLKKWCGNSFRCQPVRRGGITRTSWRKSLAFEGPVAPRRLTFVHSSARLSF